MSLNTSSTPEVGTHNWYGIVVLAWSNVYSPAWTLSTGWPVLISVSIQPVSPGYWSKVIWSTILASPSEHDWLIHEPLSDSANGL